MLLNIKAQPIIIQIKIVSLGDNETNFEWKGSKL